jgi:hypothetical protein
MCEKCNRIAVKKQFASTLDVPFHSNNYSDAGNYNLPHQTGFNFEREQPAINNGLPKFRHFIEPKSIDIHSKKWITSGVSEMNPQNMNPGFIADNDQILVKKNLQEALSQLIKTKYKKYIRSNTPSNNDNFSISLIDLSGDKVLNPEYAGWGSVVPKYAASTAKIIPIYGIFQLKFDLETLLNKENVTTLSDAKKQIISLYKKYRLINYKPDWHNIFDYNISSTGKTTLSFKNSLAKIIEDTIHNNNTAASKLIHAVSYPYLASILLQSGITHTSRGGLWIVRDYGGVNKSWENRPSTKFKLAGSHNATALSASTYFTLLSQGRLVSDIYSKQIKEILRNGCSFFRAGTSKLNVSKQAPAKCGIWSAYYNDVIMIETDDGKYKYVVSVFSNLAKDNTFLLDKLLIDVDKIIKTNN